MQWRAMITNNNYLASIAGTGINYSTFWLELCILLTFYFIHQCVYRLWIFFLTGLTGWNQKYTDQTMHFCMVFNWSGWLLRHGGFEFVPLNDPGFWQIRQEEKLLLSRIINPILAISMTSSKLATKEAKSWTHNQPLGLVPAISVLLRTTCNDL